MFYFVCKLGICLKRARYCSVLLVFLWLPAAWAAESVVDEADTTKDTNALSGKGATLSVLGIGWHPGFCETRPNLAECRSKATAGAAARQFTLRGLWKLRQSYCGVTEALKERDKKRKWLDMPELVLEDDLKLALAQAMPGTVSGLDRHEWIKHGTCSGEVAAGYYSRALKLLAAVNESEVQALFVAHRGKSLAQDDIQQAFDTAFGPGAGERVKMRCAKDGNRQVITGLTIGLGAVDDAGQDAAGPDLATLIAAAGKTSFGCAAGIVDEPGLQ